MPAATLAGLEDDREENDARIIELRAADASPENRPDEGHPMTLVLILNDLRAERERLADLYERMDKLFDGELGSWSSKTAVSDAIDAVDRAIGACPREAAPSA